MEQSYSFATGPPSEDAVAAEFSVETDYLGWKDFIVGTVDEASHEISVDITPTSQD